MDPNFHASAPGSYEIFRNGKDTGDSDKHRDRALADIRERKAKDHARYELRWKPICTDNKAEALTLKEDTP